MPRARTGENGVADCYLGEIRTFAGKVPPKGWLLCDGRVLKVAENQALASLLGYNYGGNGADLFALPDLRGRTPTGINWQNPVFGETGGQEAVALTTRQIPPHTHDLTATTTPGTGGGVPNAIFAAVAGNGAVAAVPVYVDDIYANQRIPMDPGSVTSAGGSLPHNNMQPYLVLNYMIAIQGHYPEKP